MFPTNSRKLGSVVIFCALTLMGGSASAHCDGLDGPVVNAARNALAKGNVNHVLIWVRSEDEAEIQTAFNETVRVRGLGPEAQALADRYFFETLVRVHRAGEGAPYTGLKPAGRDLGPAIPGADAAIASGSDEALTQLLTEEVRHGLRTQFQEVVERKDFATDDLAAGRAYVEAYVPYIHYVEALYEAVTRTAVGHFDDH